jgi:ACR3 family arsenite efflux pump ArsB
VRFRPLVRRAALTALVVGTVLTAINQGDQILANHMSAALIWKVPLTYCVPYVVASFGAMSICRRT